MKKTHGSGAPRRAPARGRRGVLGALLLAGCLLSPLAAVAQEPGAASAAAPLTKAQLDELRETLERHMRRERGQLESLQSQVDVVTLHMRLRDVAHVDHVRFFGPPYGTDGDPRTIRAYVFVPRDLNGSGAGSLVVWQRGDGAQEIDSWSDVPELREMLGRGVTIIAPDYPGAPEERLDEVPEYALDRYPFLDAGRVEWRPPS